MKRYTTLNNNKYVASSEYIVTGQQELSGELIDELAMYENLVEKLITNIDNYNRDIALLRSEGKEKTHRCKELVAQKIMTRTTLALLDANGLENKTWNA